MPNVSSNRRMKGPIEQDALLSFALPSRSAERPSKSRRLTSLPSAAPTVLPSRSTISTTSGSGLFQVESDRMPISPPQPIVDSVGLFVKISASGPIATSRYSDHMPSSTSAAFSASASGDPGTTERMLPPTRSSRRARTATAADASPRARSSITRSSADTAKVTPDALTHCRSIGLSRRILAPGSGDRCRSSR